MNFSQLVDQLITQTTERSLWCFAPELAISVTIVLLLLVRLVSIDRFVPNYMFALLGAFAAFGLSLYQGYQFSTGQAEAGTFFTGLMVYDQFTVFFRVFLLLFLILTITLTVLTGIPDNEDGPDFYTLLLGATLGMIMMAGANHLLMLFLAIEMASVPSYVMVGFLKGRKSSSEAALKYVVYGAGTAGVMLYGISLLCGLCGTGDMPAIADRISLIVQNDSSAMAAAGMANGTVRAIVLGIVLVLVGLAFKLSLVPFHFWCPDAFEGAAAEVGGFLSVASKAGAFALLLRFVLAFCGGEPSVLSEVYMYLGLGLGAVGIVTATYGNLTAYGQSNIKRMLAYSTIAHAGYMIMAVSALIVILNAPEMGGAIDRVVDGGRAIEGLLYYLAVYMFMNLGAFAVVALIRNETFSEEIEDYSGIASQAPWLSVAMLICMFSLIGMPPFGGFFAKLMIFASVYQAGTVHWFMYVVLAFGGLNTVFSLFYYIRVLKTMFIRERPADARPVKVGFHPSLYVMTLAAFVLFLGVFSQWMQGLSSRASDVAHEVLAPQAQVQPANSDTVVAQDAR